MTSILKTNKEGDIFDLFCSGDIYKRIEDSSFKGIQLGSYFKVIWRDCSCNDNRVITFRVAGFDLYDLDRHHLVIVPDEIFGEDCMNLSNTTETGYYKSYLNKHVIGPVATSGGTGTVNQILYSIFGEHLFTTKEYLSVDNKGTFVYFDCQAVIMSEYEVFGKNQLSNDGNVDKKEQLPLFKLVPEYTRKYREMGYWWWNRDIATTARFCGCDNSGYAHCARASYFRGVRPRFVIG